VKEQASPAGSARNRYLFRPGVPAVPPPGITTINGRRLLEATRTGPVGSPAASDKVADPLHAVMLTEIGTPSAGA
jgi:hypothetical protein